MRVVSRAHAKIAVRLLLSLIFLTSGVFHFLTPEPFLKIMPAALPAKLLLVQISGACELAGAVGLQIPRLRIAAAWGLFALLIAVFPANINQAVNQIQLSDTPILAMGEVATSYYLRMRVDDKPGVLADITRILADRDISIDAMIQKEPSEGEFQTDIILLTHLTIEKNVDAAIGAIEALPTVKGRVVRIRLEELS